MVITLNPNLEIDRSSTTPGIALRVFSMGDVTNCSTSCVARVGQTVRTCTWLLVLSGIASIGSWVNDQMPKTQIEAVSNPIRTLL